MAFIPETITSKYNRLILGNTKELYFDVDTTDYDTRAYRFPVSSTLTRISNAPVVGYDEIEWNGSAIVKVAGRCSNSRIIEQEEEGFSFDKLKTDIDISRQPVISIPVQSCIWDLIQDLIKQFVPQRSYP